MRYSHNVSKRGSVHKQARGFHWGPRGGGSALPGQPVLGNRGRAQLAVILHLLRGPLQGLSILLLLGPNQRLVTSSLGGPAHKREGLWRGKGRHGAQKGYPVILWKIKSFFFLSSFSIKYNALDQFACGALGLR